MTTEEKLDQIIKDQAVIIQNQAVLIQMVTDAMERKPPDMTEALKPILENPLIAGNPSVVNMLNKFMGEMGGK
jgi:hypothetical protein